MRVLLDQGTPVGIRDSLPKHTVATAHQQGWSTLLNGELLRVAEQSGFDVLVTTDKNLAYQQNLRKRKIAIVVLGQSRWNMVRRAIPRIVAAIESAEAGSYTIVEIA